MPPTKRRRVTYVLPLPTESLPILSLPHHWTRRPGDSRPLIRRRDGLATFAKPEEPHAVSTHQPAGHPQHRLGIAGLAIDTSTIVVSQKQTDAEEPSPRGILYAGGRDGLLSAWELGLPMRKRKRRYGHGKNAALARAIRWGDVEEDDVAAINSDEENENLFQQLEDSSTQLAFGEAEGLDETKPMPSSKSTSQVAYEEKWEVDPEALKSETSLPSSAFRQSVRTHSDWINAIALCNLNRTVISASSDRTHTDYVKTLAAPRDADWVASGGFDRLINIWDIQERRHEPIRSFPEDASQASVYSLASDLTGNLLASGSPEKVVRLWDHRSGRQCGRLVGHTDNIRCIIASHDGKLLLSGSTDSDIKLWSVGEQRCIETFSYHTESVWALFSNHPYLDVFYSGDRSGMVCKVDMDGCRDAATADCVLLLHDAAQSGDASGADGINSIVAVDDTFVWTATGSSSIKRWKDVSARPKRMKALHSTATPAATARSTVEDAFEEREPLLPLAVQKSSQQTVQFASSIRTTPTYLRSPSLDFSDRLVSSRSGTPLQGHRASFKVRAGSAGMPSPQLSQLHRSPRTNEVMLRGVPIESLISLGSLSDTYLPRAVLHGEPLSMTWSARSFSFHRVSSLLDASPLATSPRDEATTEDMFMWQAQEQHELRDEAVDAAPLQLAPDETIYGLRGLISCDVLNDRRHVLAADKRGDIALWDIVLGVCIGAFDRSEVDTALGYAQEQPNGSATRARPIKEALELIKQRIEGEDATSAWATVDVRSGCISVHLEEARAFEGEQYADASGFADYLRAPHQRVNLGKTVLRALFDGFIAEECRLHSNEQRPPMVQRQSTDTPRMSRAYAPAHISLHDLREGAISTLGSDKAAIGMAIVLATPALTPVLPPIAADHTAKQRLRDARLTPIPQSPHRETGPQYAANPEEGGDYFSSPASAKSSSTPAPTEPPSSPIISQGTTFMGRIRGLGRKPKGGAMEAIIPRDGETANEESRANGSDEHAQSHLSAGEIEQLNMLRTLFTRPLSPSAADETPPIMLPSSVILIISEEAPESASWQAIYRGAAASTANELKSIEMASPSWLLEFLLFNRALVREPSKVAFVVTPWEGPGAMPLKELPEGNNRLSANRTLRIVKVATYCAERVGDPTPASTEATSSSSSPAPPATVPRSSSAVSIGSSVGSRPSSTGTINKNLLDLEILVGDEVIPPHVTLAQALRFWQRRPGDLLLTYRVKMVNNNGTALPSTVPTRLT